MSNFTRRLGRLITELKGKLQVQAEDNDHAPTRPYEVIKTPQAYLTLEGAKTPTVLLHPGFLIGRGSSCHLVLTDPNASRVHASISRQAGGWFLQDNFSTNGTLVNGAKISVAPLRAGDRIQIGQTVLVYEER